MMEVYPIDQLARDETSWSRNERRKRMRCCHINVGSDTLPPQATVAGCGSPADRGNRPPLGCQTLRHLQTWSDNVFKEYVKSNHLKNIPTKLQFYFIGYLNIKVKENNK